MRWIRAKEKVLDINKCAQLRCPHAKLPHPEESNLGKRKRRFSEISSLPLRLEILHQLDDMRPRHTLMVSMREAQNLYTVWFWV